ncbi:hypothetical protein ACOSQ2_022150 [Xanthoceras sorbifolium]
MEPHIENRLCCHERTEDLNHLFRDCQAAKEVWNKVWRGCWNTNVFSAGFFEWLQSNLRCKNYGAANIPWFCREWLTATAGENKISREDAW